MITLSVPPGPDKVFLNICPTFIIINKEKQMTLFIKPASKPNSPNGNVGF